MDPLSLVALASSSFRGVQLLVNKGAEIEQVAQQLGKWFSYASDIRQAEREAENSTLAKFIRNLESRIYAQFAKQLVESMFANDNPAGFGSFILEGNTITWEVIVDESGAEFIRLTVVAEDGTSTVIEIPVGTGNFAQDPDGG